MYLLSLLSGQPIPIMFRFVWFFHLSGLNVIYTNILFECVSDLLQYLNYNNIDKISFDVYIKLSMYIIDEKNNCIIVCLHVFQHYTNVIQMFCLYWPIHKSDEINGALSHLCAHIHRLILGQESMVRCMRWHCPPDTGFEIRTLAVWGEARYFSVTEAPHNIGLHIEIKTYIMYSALAIKMSRC